ncbi:MAG: hypothetical protein ACRBCT_07685 [Alphaproteobacteria bacterium]
MSNVTQETRAKLELEFRLKEAQASAIRIFEAEKPALAKLVSSRTTNIVYKKRPKGYTKIIPDIIALMVEADNIDKTQKQLIEDVSAKHPKQDIAQSIWSKDLQKYDLDAIKKQLEKDGLPPEIVKGCKKLSQVRKKLKDHLYEEREKTREFKINISVNKKRVVIGKKSYPVVLRNSKNKKYPCIRVNLRDKRHWLRIDVLTKALLEGEI